MGLGGCGASDDTIYPSLGRADPADQPNAREQLSCAEDALPYAIEIRSFEPGAGSGFGADKLPQVVLGAPRGGSATSGSLDVLSLGHGGVIVLGFGNREVLDGPGADFVIFENAFFVGGDESQVWSEPGLVSVSGDGETWRDFPCDPSDVDNLDNECAGMSPSLAFDACEHLELSAEIVGGDAYDLASLGVGSIRFIRITDASENSADSVAGTTVGFDLDAVGLINWRGISVGE